MMAISCWMTTLLLLISTLLAGSSSAFVAPARRVTVSTTTTITPRSTVPTDSNDLRQRQSYSSTSSTMLSERRWNFNEGQGPFGLKKNAEIWNGRVAQMCFVAVFAQELISGKGVIQGIQEGDVFNLACLGATVLTILGLTVFLAIKGEDSYVDKMMGRK